jgi:hypothetical protein
MVGFVWGCFGNPFLDCVDLLSVLTSGAEYDQMMYLKKNDWIFPTNICCSYYTNFYDDESQIIL